MPEVAHVNIFVEDQNKALTFYTEKLGFEVAEDLDFGGVRWLTLKGNRQGNFHIILAAATTPEDILLIGKQGGSCPLLGFESPDLDNDYETMKAKGVQFLGSPESHSWGKSVILKDLYGNMIYMVESPR